MSAATHVETISWRVHPDASMLWAACDAADTALVTRCRSWQSTMSHAGTCMAFVAFAAAVHAEQQSVVGHLVHVCDPTSKPRCMPSALAPLATWASNERVGRPILADLKSLDQLCTNYLGSLLRRPWNRARRGVSECFLVGGTGGTGLYGAQCGSRVCVRCLPSAQPRRVSAWSHCDETLDQGLDFLP